MTIRFTSFLDSTPTFDIRAAQRIDHGAAIRAGILAEKEGGHTAYHRVVTEMMNRYQLDIDTVVSLGEAAGTLSAALRLLNDGMPADYVLALGEA